MEQRNLGSEGLTVSTIGLGCMGMSQAYGPADDTESITTLQRAVDLGVTFWDTSMSYGAGHNERLVGRALQGRRDQVVLATKFGIVRNDDGVRVDVRPERVRGDCDASLARLGVDHLDLYYQHRVDPDVPIEETVGAMAALVDEGKVRHIGLSEAGATDLERAAATHPITALQSEWSLWWRGLEDSVVPAARRLGIGLVPFSPLGRGALTGTIGTQGFGCGDARRLDPRFQDEHLGRNLALVDELRGLAAERGLTPAQVALGWLVAQGDDVVPIAGTKHPARLEENAAAASVALSSEDLEQLEAVVGRAAWSGDRRAFGAPTARAPA